MYRLIIVDDEDEVREGMRRKTDWTGCGFELAGDYSNGREALDAVEQLRPDVVITDICMPYMDGLELAEQIYTRFRGIRVVIVTGYESFDYAKQAIRLKVDDYLLKPVNLEEFTRFLRTLRTELDAEHARMRDWTSLRQRLNESLPLLRDRLLERFTAGRLTAEETAAKLEELGLRLPESGGLALVAELDPAGDRGPSDADEELRAYAVYNIFEEICGREREGLVFRLRDEKVGILLPGRPGEAEMAAQLAAELGRQAAERYLKRTVSVGIGRVCAARELLPRSFQEALSALDYRFLHGGNQVLALQDMEFGRTVNRTDYGAYERRIAAVLRAGDPERIEAALSDWQEEMKAAGAALRECYDSAGRLLDAVLGVISETGFRGEELFGDDPGRGLPALPTLEELKCWLYEACLRAVAFLAEKRGGVNRMQMLQAEAYIQANYADPALSVGQVAGHVFLSMNYFGTLFKQHAGCTFVEYLTRLRVDKAKELLKLTPLKAYDIAGRVGYADPQYFSVIFKKATGMTPKEYRASLKETG